jgi:hypothetical protein
MGFDQMPFGPADLILIALAPRFADSWQLSDTSL